MENGKRSMIVLTSGAVLVTGVYYVQKSNLLKSKLNKSEDSLLHDDISNNESRLKDEKRTHNDVPYLLDKNLEKMDVVERYDASSVRVDLKTIREMNDEKGDSLVQPENPVAVISEKGDSLVQPEKSAFILIKKTRTEKIDIEPPYVRMPDMKLAEGETRDSFPGVKGVLERELEEYVANDGTVYLTKVLAEKKTDPVVRVHRYGTLKNGEIPGKIGVYNVYEHFPNTDFSALKLDVKSSAEEIRKFSSEELYSKAKGDYSNTLHEVTKPGIYVPYAAPVSDSVIDGINSGVYFNHKLLGEEMLKLVNEERIRVGQKPLLWSNSLANYAKLRSEELASNGNIRFFNEKNESMPHTRDNSGKKWWTIFDGTKYANALAGENTAAYNMKKNVYSLFSEKYIAETLFTQWKNSPHHYENIIYDKYGHFGFYIQISKFWRDDKDTINYHFKGIEGVQLFGNSKFGD